MTTAWNRSGRLRPAAAAVVLCLATAGCTDGDAEPDVTYSTLGVPGEVLCGFVPKADLEAALGSKALSAKGSLNGREGNQPLTNSGCAVTADRRTANNFEVVVWGRGLDHGFTTWQLKNLKPGQTAFPAEAPIGLAEPKYESRLDGTNKNGELRKGAVATAVYGDWYINLRIFRPGAGRNAVQDSITLVQQIIAALQLPAKATQTYPEFTPDSSVPSSTPTK